MQPSDYGTREVDTGACDAMTQTRSESYPCAHASPDLTPDLTSDIAANYMQGMYLSAALALKSQRGELVEHARAILEQELHPLVERKITGATPAGELDPATVYAALLLMTKTLAWAEQANLPPRANEASPMRDALALRRRRIALRSLFGSILDELDGTHTFICSEETWQRLQAHLLPAVVAELKAAHSLKEVTRADAHETCGDAG